MRAGESSIIPPIDISEVQDDPIPGEKVPLAGLRATSSHRALIQLLQRFLRVGSWAVLLVQACLEVLTLLYPSSLVAVPAWVQVFPFTLVGFGVLGSFELYRWLVVSRSHRGGMVDVKCPRCGLPIGTDDLGLKELRYCPRCQAPLLVHWSKPI